MSKFLLILSFYRVDSTANAAETNTFEQLRLKMEAESCGDKIEVAPGWGGEYPGRVVDVKQTTTLEALTGPCSFGTKSCTIKPGLYHPWTQDHVSRTAYISVASKTSYIATQDILHYQYVGNRELKDVTYPKGTRFDYVRYSGEGNCLYKVKGQNIVMDCQDRKDLKLVSKETNRVLGNETWELLSVQCEEGHLGWLRVDDALFQKKETVLEGAITGYGTIGPHGERGI